jgi:predicted nucleic acid-binding Zn finger protein
MAEVVGDEGEFTRLEIKDDDYEDVFEDENKKGLPVVLR